MESTSTPSVTTTSVAVRYGLLTGVVSIIYSFVLFATNQEMNTVLGWLGLVISIGGIVLAHLYFRQHNGGFMSYGQGIGIGVLLALISGTLTAIFRYLYATFIDPDMVQRTAEAMRAKLAASGSSEEQIEQAVAMSQKFSSGPVSIVFGIIAGAIGGLILSLIISAITKRNRPEFE